MLLTGSTAYLAASSKEEAAAAIQKTKAKGVDLASFLTAPHHPILRPISALHAQLESCRVTRQATEQRPPVPPVGIGEWPVDHGDLVTSRRVVNDLCIPSCSPESSKINSTPCDAQTLWITGSWQAFSLLVPAG